MKYLNCLRIQIVPDSHQNERINSVLSFCRKYGFNNVMFFINAVDHNIGHMTKEEAKPWVETIKKAKKALNENGISVSLNPWMEIGHLDRGRSLRPGQNFTVMEDFNGLKCKLVVCPMDEEWQKYFFDFYEYLIKEIQPEVIWVEDDFRLHNHAPLAYGGCFCKNHMKAFNDKLGTDYSREQFVEKLFGNKPDKKVQKAYLDVNRECMTALAGKIGKTVKSLGLNTKVGLMSSMHDKHSMEGRDWKGIHQGLSQGGTMINRLHLPCYTEESPKMYYYNFNYYPFICRRLLPEKCEVYPELENAAFSTFAKDSEFLRFQVESALPLGLSGMTYDIFDFTGNGAIEQFGYGEAVHSCQKYFDAVISGNYSYHKLEGIVLPVDEKNAYNRNVVPNDFYSLMPDEFHLGAYIQSIGASAKTSTDKHFKNEIIALCGAAVNNFTDDELKELFGSNKVICEGGAVIRLCSRGLGNLLGIKSCRVSKAQSTLRSFEKVEEGIIINDINGYAAMAFNSAGDIAEIEYGKTPEILSRFYDNGRNDIGPAETISCGHFITPFIFDRFLIEQFNPLRRELITGYIKQNSPRIVITDYEGVCAYLSVNNGGHVLILVNSTLNTLKKVTFFTTEKPDRLCELDRDGELRQVLFTDNNGEITIDEKFDCISTKTFIW